MKKTIIALVAAVAVLLMGCGVPAVVPTVKLDVEAVICVTSELEQGVTDPLVVMKDCPNISQAFFADVQLFISSFLKGKAAAAAAKAKQNSGPQSSAASTDPKP